MKHANDSETARACLAQLSPWRCDDYETWLQVGMILKDAGCSVSDWDAWSQTSPKWKPGTCARKWASFNGGLNGTGVGVGTLVEWVRQDGGKLATQRADGPGHALTWDSEIGPAEAPQRAVSGGIPEPAEDWQPGDLVRYLNALFRPEEHVAYVCESWTDEDGKKLPRKGVWSRTAAQILAAVEKYGGDLRYALGDWDEAAGAWIRINPVDGGPGQGPNGGLADANITDYRHVLVESDKMPVEDQLRIIRELNLPCSAIVHSGSKSIHAIVRIDAGQDRKLYSERVAELFNKLHDHGFEVDRPNRNPSRLSRLPGATRNGRPQYLVSGPCGPASWEEWRNRAATEHMPDPINVSSWLEMDPPAPDQILENTLDAGDKLVLIAPSKQRKSFFFMQMMIAISIGDRFLAWLPSRARRVLIVQFEVRACHYHRRMKRMCKALEVTPKLLANNLHVLNCRGVDVEAVYRAVEKCAAWYRPEVIAFDPFYKMHAGDENSAQDIKPVLQRFDVLAESSGAAIAYVHHDSKGIAADRNIRDRGAGSNVVGRDYDVCFTITPHAEDEACSVVEVLLRNYAPQERVTVKWVDGHFDLETEREPVTWTKATKAVKRNYRATIDRAIEIAASKVWKKADLRAACVAQLDITTSWYDKNLKEHIQNACTGDKPKLAEAEYRLGRRPVYLVGPADGSVEKAVAATQESKDSQE